jgi:hypothetical protein
MLVKQHELNWLCLQANGGWSISANLPNQKQASAYVRLVRIPPIVSGTNNMPGVWKALYRQV